MALTTASLSASLSSIGISQAKGVDLPLLRDQNNATLPKADSTSSSDSKVAATTRYTASKQLTEAQQQKVTELQQIDRNVRAHEQAHMAAGHGVVTSGPNYSYTYGPDGKQYATGGEVGIDTAYERKPEANIDKGIRIQAAALAPKDPSTQDYRVASVGEQMESTGRTDLRRQQVEEQAQAQAEAAAQREAEKKAQTQAFNEAPVNTVNDVVSNASNSAGAGNGSTPENSSQNQTANRLATAYGQSSTEQATVSLFA
jgi:hypothetical protein